MSQTRRSTFIQLNKFCMVEFIKTDISNPDEDCVFSDVDTNMFKYPILSYNQIYYDNKYCIKPEDKNAIFYTNNVEKYSVFDYDSTRYGNVLSYDGTKTLTGYFKSINRIEINPTKNDLISTFDDVIYDTYRFHFASGFNINSYECIVLGIKARYNNGDYIKLANIKIDTKNWFDQTGGEEGIEDSLVELNPDPIYINNLSFISYADIKVPSIDYLIDQFSTGDSSNTITGMLTDVRYASNDITSPNGLNPTSPAIVSCDICDSSSLFRGSDNVAYELYNISEHYEGSLVLSNKFELVAAKIEEASDGNYFKYRAEYDGGDIDTFLYSLSNGNISEWSIVHQLNVVENVDDKDGHVLEYTTSRNTMYQDSSNVDKNSSYSDFLMFRPILKYSDTGCISFEIRYTLTLINNKTGEAIVKTSSVGSNKVRKYSKNTESIDINRGSIYSHKVYNKVYISQDSSTELFVDPDFEKRYRNGADNTVVERSVRYPLYVDYNAITISDDITDSKSLSSTAIVYKQGDLRLLVKPFDNNFRFKIYTTSNGVVVPLELDVTNTYKLVFLINGTKVSYESVSNDNVDPLFKTRMSMGEITFKVPESDAIKIVNSSTRDFYIVYDNYSTLQTSILYFGFWFNQNEYVEYNNHVNSIKESYGIIKEVNDKINSTLSSVQSQSTQIPSDLYIPGNVDQAVDGNEMSSVYKTTPTSQNS